MPDVQATGVINGQTDRIPVADCVRARRVVERHCRKDLDGLCDLLEMLGLVPLPEKSRR